MHVLPPSCDGGVNVEGPLAWVRIILLCDEEQRRVTGDGGWRSWVASWQMSNDILVRKEKLGTTFENPKNEDGGEQTGTMGTMRERITKTIEIHIHIQWYTYTNTRRQTVISQNKKKNNNTKSEIWDPNVERGREREMEDEN